MAYQLAIHSYIHTTWSPCAWALRRYAWRTKDSSLQIIERNHWEKSFFWEKPLGETIEIGRNHWKSPLFFSQTQNEIKISQNHWLNRSRLLFLGGQNKLDPIVKPGSSHDRRLQPGTTQRYPISGVSSLYQVCIPTSPKIWFLKII
jgi:hypothetical protein